MISKSGLKSASCLLLFYNTRSRQRGSCRSWVSGTDRGSEAIVQERVQLHLGPRVGSG